MKYIYTYYAENMRHSPFRSPIFDKKDDAIKWARDAAEKSAYPSTITVIYNTMFPGETEPKDPHSYVAWAVRPGSSELIDKDDCRYPYW